MRCTRIVFVVPGVSRRRPRERQRPDPPAGKKLRLRQRRATGRPTSLWSATSQTKCACNSPEQCQLPLDVLDRREHQQSLVGRRRASCAGLCRRSPVKATNATAPSASPTSRGGLGDCPAR